MCLTCSLDWCIFSLVRVKEECFAEACEIQCPGPRSIENTFVFHNVCRETN